MSDPISNVPPQDRAHYMQDFTKSVDLFKQSLDAYGSSQIPEQKAKYKDVMDRTLQIMNETAKLCLSKGAQNQEKTLATDYQNYMSHESPDTLKKLNSDIQNLEEKL